MRTGCSGPDSGPKAGIRTQGRSPEGARPGSGRAGPAPESQAGSGRADRAIRRPARLSGIRDLSRFVEEHSAPGRKTRAGVQCLGRPGRTKGRDGDGRSTVQTPRRDARRTGSWGSRTDQESTRVVWLKGATLEQGKELAQGFRERES